MEKDKSGLCGCSFMLEKIWNSLKDGEGRLDDDYWIFESSKKGKIQLRGNKIWVKNENEI